MSTFDRNYSAYYDLFYADKDYEAEANYVANLLGEYTLGKHVLEFGSGTGRHGLLLSRKGFDLYGIELSEGMVAQAREIGFPCEVGNITSCQVSGTFDAVISLFHVISYLTTNEEVIGAFRNAARHLNPGGIFIFDVWYTPAVLTTHPENRIKCLENDASRVTRFATPVIHSEANVVDVNYVVIVQDKQSGLASEFYEKHAMRHFSIPEIDLLGSLTGFSRVRCEEFLTKRSASDETWGVCFVMKKVGVS